MSTKRIIIAAIVAVMIFVAGFLIGKTVHCGAENTDDFSVTRETYRDTISVNMPSPESEKVSGKELYRVPSHFFRTVAGDSMNTDSSVKSVVQDSSVLSVDGAGAGGIPRCSVTDSIDIELPIVQRHYTDSAYEAWVSGPLDPKLDSVRVFNRTTVVSQREWKPPKHWHVGVTAGFGYGTKGFQPYIGIGITYSIISF